MPDGMSQCTQRDNAVTPGDSQASVPGPSFERIAKVVLIGRVGARTTYSYRVPDQLKHQVAPGHLVQVPFGPRVLQGVVLAVDIADPGDLKLRNIAESLDPLPCLTPAQLDLAHWIAAYYACDLSDAIGGMLPSGVERAAVALYEANSGADPGTARLSPLQRQLVEAVQHQGPVTAQRLASKGDPKPIAAALDSLVRRGVLARTMTLGRAAVLEQTETVVVLQPFDPTERLTERQRGIVNYLAERNGEAALSDLRDDLHIESTAVSRLVTRRIVLTYKHAVRRDPLAHRDIARHEAPAFTPEQDVVYQPIGQALAARDGSTFLLHGITGSGKTEVYLRAVADTLAAGRQAIVLVPEIGLTPQTVTRFAGRFPGQVALLHSRLSAGERYDEWQRIRRGECSVVVGARSAVFSPVSKVGLIVIDEEHDASYKQDSTPRYHTRDVAERLARITGAVVILGSATPDVTSFHKAEHGNYRLLTMRTRVHTAQLEASKADNVPQSAASNAGTQLRMSGVQANAQTDAGLPAVQIVDMRLELKAGNRSIFSRALAGAMERTLSRREQAILFLNRRGNATFVNCRDCGRVVKCRHCDIPMSYHSHGERLQCHRCDDRAPVPTLCQGCGSWRIRYFGLGTQKVEHELQIRFPGARVQRYDRDVTSGKLGHEVILNRFARGEIDVLVGTQIVAKGLDFPRVTLVGAVSADTSVNLPDFRAAERTFSLLTQVAGRAGRADLPGTVVVQTYVPGHFAIQAAANHDYAAFYQSEILYRQDGPY
ncbi:MAG: primosomal protein, partial [Chloroflexi bacterium]|nr:primosomal protein [Chloroflexota bacterium]